MRPVLALLALLSPAAASGWTYAGTFDGVEVRERSLPGTRVREVVGVATFAGRAADYVAVIDDVAGFPRFLPRVREARVIESGPGGEQVAYVRYELPWPLEPRDYVTRRIIEQTLGPDGGGEYRNRWTALPDRVPPAPGVVRLQKNDGFWHVAQFGPRTVRLEFGCAADPGGALPAWAIDTAAREAVPDIFLAIQREVLRRRERGSAPLPGR